MKKTMMLFWKMMFVLFLVMPSVAFAATIGGPTSTVINDIIQIVAYGVTTVVIALLGIAAKRLATKYHVELPQTWMASVDVFVDKAIHYAEEWAKNKVAQNETVNGNDKLNTAMAFLLQLAGDDKKLVTMTEEQIKKLIEGRLGEQRAAVGLPLSVITNESATPVVPSLPSRGEGGFATTTVILSLTAIVGIGMIVFACATLKSDSKQIAKDGVNCMVDDLFDRAKEIAPSLQENIKAAVDQATGKVNWDKVKASTKTFKSDALGCAFTLAVKELAAVVAGVGFAPLQIDKQSLVEGYEEVRKEQFGSKTFDIEVR